MADQIVQQLGFDAQGAIQELSNLDQAFGSIDSRILGLDQALRAFNASGASSIPVFANLSKAVKSAADQIERFAAVQGQLAKGAGPGTAFNFGTIVNANVTGGAQGGAQNVAQQFATIVNASNAAAGGVNQNVTRMTTSFGLLSRIIFTQAVIRGFRQIISSAQEAADEIVKFQKTAVTISLGDPLKRSAEQITEQAAQIASAFNFPEAEVLNAQLELQGTRFTDAADQAQVLTASIKLARVENIDLAQAVKLVSSNLSAFDQPAGQASEVAGTLVKNIDKADFSAVATQFGRLAETTSEAGFSLNDITKALDVLTDSGLKGREAITQLQAVMQAFTTPGTELKKIFSELGLDQASRQALGFAGTLDAVLKKINSQSALASAFPNARAFRGVGGLTEEGLNGLSSKLKATSEVGKSSAAVLEDQYGQRVSDSLDKATAAANRLNVQLTNTAGPKVQFVKEVFTQIAQDAVNGLDVLGKLFSNNGGLGDTTAIDAAFAKIEHDGEISQNIVERVRAAQAASQADFAKTLSGEAAPALEKFNEAISASLGRHKADVAEAKNEISALAATYTLLQNAGEKAFENLGHVEEQNRQQLQQSNTLVARLRVQQQLFQTTQPGGGGQDQQFQLLRFQAQTLSAKAQELQLNAGLSEEQRKTAADTQAQSAEYAQQVLSLAQQSGNADRINEAFSRAISIQKNWSAALEASNVALEKQRANIQGVVDKVGNMGKEGNDAIQTLLKSVGTLNAKNVSASDQVAAFESAKSALQALQAVGKQFSSSDFATLGFSPAQIEKVQQALQKSPLKISAAIVPTFTDVNKAAADATAQFKAALQQTTGSNIDLAQSIVGRTFKTPTDVISGLNQINKALSDTNVKILAAQESESHLADEFAALPITLQRVNGELANLKDFGGNDLNLLADLPPQLQQEVEGLVNGLQPLTNKANVTAQSVGAIGDKFNKLKSDAAAAGKQTQFELQPLLTFAQAFINTLQKIQTDKTAAAQVPGLQAKAQELQAALGNGAQPVSTASTDLKNASAAFSSSAQQGSSQIQQAAVAVAGAAAAWIQAAQTPFQTPPAPASPSPSVDFAGDWFGSLSAFASGIVGRGADRNLALIADGESVINSRATRKWFSQIQALNAGATPVFPQGQSNTTTIGDINVTVNSQGQPVNARRLMDEMRREIRRGTSRPF